MRPPSRKGNQAVVALPRTGSTRSVRSMKGEKKRILLIDDDKSILRVFSRILQKEDYLTDEAETGKEAMEKIDSQTYDMALIDMKLPDMEGMHLLRKINSVNPKMAKILITGFPSVDDGLEALDNGADAYLVKPDKVDDLLRIIKTRRPD